MLALLYATEQQWAQAKQYAHKAKDMGFTGFAAELLDEIQRHISSDSDSKGRELSTKDVTKDIKKPVDEKKSEPDFITGLWHGLTSPFRFFGLFDLNYEKKENWTGNYALGLVIGGLVILSIGLGLFNAKK